MNANQLVMRVAAAAILMSAGLVSGATFTVNNTNDSGAESLRQAVIDANANANAPTVDTINLSAIAGQTITLTTGEMIISEAVAITGTQGNTPTVSGNNASRIFFVNADTAISDVNFTAGRAQGGNGGASLQGGAGGGAAGMGGAIFVNQGIFSLTRATISASSALGGAGGSIEAGGNGGGGGGGTAGDAAAATGDLGGAGGAGGALSAEGAGGTGGSFLLFSGTAGGMGGSFGGAGGGGGFDITGHNGGAGGFGGGGGGGASGFGTGFGGAGGSFAGSGGSPGGGGGGAGLGGALFIRAGTATLTQCVFTGNTATRGSGVVNGQGKGGAIFVNSGATFVDGVMTFSGNNASDDAGTLGDDNNIYGADVVPVGLSGAEID